MGGGALETLRSSPDTWRRLRRPVRQGRHRAGPQGEGPEAQPRVGGERTRGVIKNNGHFPQLLDTVSPSSALSPLTSWRRAAKAWPEGGPVIVNHISHM